DDLLASVRRCWASLFSARSLMYGELRHRDTTDRAMAVIVQRLIKARSAGVAFTADPVTSDASTIVIEAIFGLGEPLVSGTIQPDRYRIDKGTFAIAERTIANKAKRLVWSPE